MLVYLVGPPCAGKATIADFLVSQHSFRRILLLAPPGAASSSSSFSSASAAPPVDDNTSTRPTDSNSAPLRFASVEQVVAYATAHHQANFVLTWPPSPPHRDSDTAAAAAARDGGPPAPSLTRAELLEVRRRPFSLLVAVDAPFSVRLARWRLRRRAPASDSDAAAFLAVDEAALYGSPPAAAATGAPRTDGDDGGFSEDHADGNFISLYELMRQADLTLLATNSGSPIPADWKSQLHARLAAIDVTNPTRLRPSWDLYFMRLCNLAASRSNCLKRRVGCVITRDRRVIATGYNGTPRGIRNCSEGGCRRCAGGAGRGEKLDECWCLHAEENALLESGRERIAGDGASILYCNTCPCIGCAKKIVQAGVQEVVYLLSYGAMDTYTRSLFDEAGVTLRQMEDDHRPSGQVFRI
ncbi:cytidine deaminase-like protein [Zopfochytrium polystomum]|nr:cytidine deaminase-like protein [Zopfochytrium polystomum]